MDLKRNVIRFIGIFIHRNRIDQRVKSNILIGIFCMSTIWVNFSTNFRIFRNRVRTELNKVRRFVHIGNFKGCLRCNSFATFYTALIFKAQCNLIFQFYSVAFIIQFIMFCNCNRNEFFSFIDSDIKQIIKLYRMFVRTSLINHFNDKIRKILSFNRNFSNSIIR